MSALIFTPFASSLSAQISEYALSAKLVPVVVTSDQFADRVRELPSAVQDVLPRVIILLEGCRTRLDAVELEQGPIASAISVVVALKEIEILHVPIVYVASSCMGAGLTNNYSNYVNHQDLAASDKKFIDLVAVGVAEIIRESIRCVDFVALVSRLLNKAINPSDVLVIESDDHERESIKNVLLNCQISHELIGNLNDLVVSKIQEGAYQVVLFGINLDLSSSAQLNDSLIVWLEFAKKILPLVSCCLLLKNHGEYDLSILSSFFEIGVSEYLLKPCAPFLIQNKCKTMLRQCKIKHFASDSITKSLISSTGAVTDTSNINVADKRQSNSSISLNPNVLTIDDFELVSLIGEGAFGKVLMVRYKKTSKVFAMKIIRKAEVVTSDKPRQVLSERQILEAMDNAFIVNLFVAFQDEENLYLVLRFAGGGDLFTQLEKRKRLPEDAARFYCAELVLAIEALHKNLIIYRDLKPENILLSLDGHLLLTDFGMSKQLKPTNIMTESLCGTPEYLAPEVVQGKAYSFAVDWWCLGIILYEMLVGKTPFHARDLTIVVNRILNDRVEYPPFVSIPAIGLIESLLCRDPFKRLGCKWLTNKENPSLGAAELKSHPFFASIRWDKLALKKITPPYLPINDEVHVKDPDDQEEIRSLEENEAAKAIAGSIFNEFTNFIHPELTVGLLSTPNQRKKSIEMGEVDHKSNHFRFESSDKKMARETAFGTTAVHQHGTDSDNSIYPQSPSDTSAPRRMSLHPTFPNVNVQMVSTKLDRSNNIVSPTAANRPSMIASHQRIVSMDSAIRAPTRLAPLDVTNSQPQNPVLLSPTNHVNSTTKLQSPNAIAGKGLSLNIASPSHANAPLVPASPAYLPPNSVAGPAKLRTRQVIAPLETDLTSPKVRRNQAPPSIHSFRQSGGISEASENASLTSLPSTQSRFSFATSASAGGTRLKNPSFLSGSDSAPK